MDPKNITAFSPDYFSIGWFKYPVGIEENYKVVSDVHDGLIVVSLFLNPVLLAVIIKNQGSITQTNSSILLAANCLINITVNCFGVLHFFRDLVSYELMATALSMFIPMYYHHIRCCYIFRRRFRGIHEDNHDCLGIILLAPHPDHSGYVYPDPEDSLSQKT